MKFSMFIISILITDTIVAFKQIDKKLLRCLVCRSTISEIEGELGKIDPSRETEIGNYRLDAQGNILHKKIPLAESEIHISGIIDEICKVMSNYVRATYKSNGQLTILKAVTSSGAMNPEMNKVDIIRDNDLNKSLKYYCERIVEEYEESMITLFVQKKNNIKRRLCTNIANVCDPDDFIHEDDDDSEENEAADEHDEL